VERLSDPVLLEHVRNTGAWLGKQLTEIAGRSDRIRAVRGVGYIWGLDVMESAGEIVKRGWGAGLLALTAGDHTLRILPPLIMERDDLARGLSILESVIAA
jgi:acetylornithine/succinyldiaminopimelate/putrescine aminotransferase